MDALKLPLEELLYLRLGKFFDQLHGRKVPELYKVLMDQVDRAVLRQAIERHSGQMQAAAEFLGVDRNTPRSACCSRAASASCSTASSGKTKSHRSPPASPRSPKAPTRTRARPCSARFRSATRRNRFASSAARSTATTSGSSAPTPCARSTSSTTSTAL